MNYKEMPEFIKLAESLGADVYFWEFRDWGTNFGKKYRDIAVFEKYHKNYNDFAKLLQNPIFKQKNVHLNNYLKTIKPISKKEIIKNRYMNFKKNLKKIAFLYSLTKY